MAVTRPSPRNVKKSPGYLYLLVLPALLLALVRAAFAAAGAARRLRGRAATALVGVVEAASCELDAARGEHLLRALTAGGAGHLGMLCHRVLDLKNVAARRAAIIITCHGISS